ncbi:YjfB family protein [Clostridium butyricum]|uniref:Motility protein n=1 Tax=Clostridium butyricum E4 str. BoNT E BL5262 TaxID=632245 RepID=C4IDL7_CLOBU|nr:YjfB family protein [Clostridium butyricum]APF22092.1 motility family protein [Clostridium butyricum]EDT75238.1 conserved hypothetical protein [Clostridium butyricum 5521]EEP55240.1 conserved hypothetical protein [Clostridium butyricum E4 str. BoNT E BL5262]NFL31304.1 putative motility protein [Clostridium butyricum]NFS18205.1 putative motility protein [Clostridium butyricum]
MDIATLSITMNESTIQNQVQMSLLRMTMDNSSVINENMTEMIDNMAIDTNVGVNLDVSV